MFGKYFEYNNHKSTDFGLMIGGLNMSTDIPFAMARDTYVGALNRYKNKVNHMGTKWSGVLQFTISFVKDTCVSPNDMVFTEEEVNAINSWLTSPDFPLLFHMYDEDLVETDEYDRLYFHKSAFVDGDNTLLLASTYFNQTIGFDSTGTITSDYTIRSPLPVEEGNPIEQNLHPPIRVDIEDDYISVVYEHGSNDLIYKSCRLNHGARSKKSNSSTWSLQDDDTCRLLINGKLTRNRKYDYFGVFTDVTSQTIDGDVIGFNATFTTNSPFAWTEEKKVVFTPTSDDTSEPTSSTITVDSAEQEREIYPLIEIWCKSDDEYDYNEETGEYSGSITSRETVTISNLRDTDTTIVDHQAQEVPRSLTLEVPHMPVYVDCERGRIYDVVTTASGYVNEILDFDDLGLSDLSHIYWPRLFNGENTWQITSSTSDFTVTVTYREPRKVGAY